jgi:hypothetical protein
LPMRVAVPVNAAVTKKVVQVASGGVYAAVWTAVAANRQPSGLEALLTMALLPVWFGLNHFGQESWLALSQVPGFEVHWPLYAALTIHLTANTTEDQVSDFLQKAGSIGGATPILRRIAAEGDGLALGLGRPGASAHRRTHRRLIRKSRSPTSPKIFRGRTPAGRITYSFRPGPGAPASADPHRTMWLG